MTKQKKSSTLHLFEYYKTNEGIRRQHSTLNLFTLLELLTVIAIIAILAALLISGLSRAKKFAKRVMCANNMKQMGLAELNYTQNNRGYYTPALLGDEWIWDDLLSDYDGRTLSNTAKSQIFLYKTQFPKLANLSKIYVCPEDITYRNSTYYPKAYMKTYSINSIGWCSDPRIPSGITRVNVFKYSVPVTRVKSPSSTVGFAPMPYKNNFLGAGYAAGFCTGEECYLGPVDNIPPGEVGIKDLGYGLHGRYKMNLLFLDFHARLTDMRPFRGMASKTGIWSIQPND